MPRKKKISLIDHVAENDVSVQPEEVAEQPQSPDSDIRKQDDENLQQLLADIAGCAGARVTVYRANRNEPLKYMFQCSPEAFSLDELRDKYNGGDFRLYIARDGKLWKNLRISVEPPPVQNVSTKEQTDLLMALREGFEKQREIMQSFVESIRMQQPSMGTMADLIGSITAAIGALRRVSEPATVPASTQVIDPGRAVDLILKGVELGREIVSEGGSKSIIDLLGDLIKSPLLSEALKSSYTQPVPRRPAPAVVTTAAVSASAGNHANHSVIKTNPEDMNENMIKQYVNFLVNKAKLNSDPTLYADFIIDNVPEDIIEFVVKRKDLIDYLTSLNPEVAQHKQWFEELHRALLDGINSASDSEPLTSEPELPKN